VDPHHKRDDQPRFEEQDSWGHSIAALRANLRLTPLQRLQQGEQAARSILELKRVLKPKH